MRKVIPNKCCGGKLGWDLKGRCRICGTVRDPDARVSPKPGLLPRVVYQMCVHCLIEDEQLGQELCEQALLALVAAQ